MKSYLQFLLFALLCLNVTQSYALFYPVSEIPDSLLENADAVVRYSKESFDMQSLDKCYHSIKEIKTILNRDAKDDATLVWMYDPDTKIKTAWLKIYNKEGSLITSYSKSDFDDASYDPFGHIFLDSRYLRLKPSIKEYPITIEYEVEYIYGSSFNLSDWYPVSGYNECVQKSIFEITVPENYKYNFKEYNLGENVTSSFKSNLRRWEMLNYKAIESEPFSPSFIEFAPVVKVNPTKFEFNSFKGDLSTWSSFGNFVAELNKDRDLLPPETILKVKELTQDAENDVEKTKILYEYMQSVTKYVSIQIGIGGWRPFPAEVVDDKGYGDCKALSNYMYALLKAASIKSYYALIRAGANKYYFDASFVNNSFNHAILCVPFDSDTVWLECTSQTIPFGFLGDFTDNRMALLITENGGVLKRTTSYSKDNNVASRRALVTINPEGESIATVNSNYQGLVYDDIHGKMLLYNVDDQKKKLYSSIDIPNFELLSFKYDEHKSISPSVDESLNLELKNYCTSSGSRLFIPLNLMNKIDYIPPRDTERIQDIVINNAYVSIDTIEYFLPKGYEIEHLPEGITVDSGFGLYQTQIQHDGNVITYIRRREKNSGRFPKEKYDEFVSFYKKMRKADKAKLILKKIS